MIHLRHVEQMLETLLEMDDRPLAEPRPFVNRLAERCHHYALLFVAMLRHKGFPARARGGFGAYFNAPKFEDHWVAEYWDSARQRWIRADAKLDDVWLSKLPPLRAPLDLSAEDFVDAAAAWRRCREKGAAPDLYGISFVPLHGLWFIAGSLIRDTAALNKDEMLPWDSWGAQPKPNAQLGQEEMVLFDNLAKLTGDPDRQFAALRALYRSDDRVRVTDKVHNALTEEFEVTLSAGWPASAGG
jgi:Transglutaminase-like superfamily